MDIQNINLNQPDNEENKTSKSSKAKKIIGKAAVLGGAAGLGAAAAVSAEAMTAGEEVEEIFAETMSSVDDIPEDVVVEPEVFNPNDIKLDGVTEVELYEDIASTHSAQNVSVDDVVSEVLSPEPITMESSLPSDNTAMIDIDSMYAEPEDYSESNPEDNWDVDGCNSAESIDDVLLADIPDSGEPDVLDDILNA
jgi:ABC-type glycerol-3-phosphate transport system substrate-binding protein